MKRKILSVLSVLMAVLMSTAAFSACSKTPAGSDSSGEPSVSESAAESGESERSEQSQKKGQLYESICGQCGNNKDEPRIN